MESEIEQQRAKGISLKATGIILGVLAFLVSVFLVVSLFIVSDKYNAMHDAMHSYMDWKEDAMTVQLASDSLTEEIHSYVATGDSRHLDDYFAEIKSGRRQKAIEDIEKRLPESEFLVQLKEAVSSSVSLENEEYAAMRAVYDTDPSQDTSADYWQSIINFDMSKSVYLPTYLEQECGGATYDALTNDQKIDLAYALVFGPYYERQKDIISSNVMNSLQELDDMMKDSVHVSAVEMKTILIAQQILVGLNVVFLITIILITSFYIVRPIRRAIVHLANDESVIVTRGAKEYRYLADAYNQVREQNIQNQERLAYEAEHDKLTSLYNRTGYDTIFRKVKLDKAVYILLDIDKFKNINDEHGHAIGDNVLVRVAQVISKAFDGEKTSVCRLGGDEFSVIIEDIEKDSSDVLRDKVRSLNEELIKNKKNCPGVSLSAGIAYGDINDTTDTLFKKADIALYYTKRNGRADACIYEFGTRIVKS